MTLFYLLLLLYMACVCSRYNARSALDSSRALFSRNVHGPIKGHQKHSKKPYDEQLILLTLKVQSLITGKSESRSCCIDPTIARSARQGLRLR